MFYTTSAMTAAVDCIYICTLQKYLTPSILRAVDSAGMEYGSELVRVDDGLKGKKARYSYGFTGRVGS